MGKKLLAVALLAASASAFAGDSPYLIRALGPHGDGVAAVAFSPNGALCATGGGDRTVRVWDPRTGRLVQELSGHSGTVRALAFSPDRRWLASASADRTVRVWDAATWRKAAVLKLPKGAGLTLAFSPDGRSLAASGDGRIVRVWSAENWKSAAELKDARGDVTALAFSPDGQFLLSAGREGIVRVYDASAWALVQTSARDPDEIEDLAFTPDGKSFATAGLGGTAKLWDTNGRRILTLTGHEGAVRKIAFSPDGDFAATGGADQTVRLWDLSTGAQVRLFSGHAGPVAALAFSPDGSVLASGASGDPDLRLWNALTAYVRAPATDLKTGSGEVIKAIPLRTEVKIRGGTPSDFLVRADGLKGFVARDDISFDRPKLDRPVIRIIDRAEQGTGLYLRGAVYGDSTIAKVGVNGREAARASFDAGGPPDFADVFPFEELVDFSSGAVTISAEDRNGGRSELRIEKSTPTEVPVPR